jgi:LacI family transcriptional regulator
MRRTRRSVTIHDVAKAAGVSISTVSRVLNNKDDVSLETYKKVQTVIASLRYTSSLAARSMRSHQTNVIGLIIPDVASPYCLEVLRGINQAIVHIEHNLIVFTTGDFRKHGTAEQEREFVALLNGGITDGVIVVTPTATNFPTDAPVVAIDPNKDSPDCLGVIATNKEGSISAMNYLTGLGHRRIGFITGRLDLISACQRLDGYRDGLAAAGIPFDDTLVHTGDYTAETAVECSRRLLELADRPTAIFASNDMSATGVYQASREAGLRIPEDLSVIGFDNLPEAEYLKPRLTTVNQHIREMGRLATDMLVMLIRGEELERTLHKIETQLILRESCTLIQKIPSNLVTAG